MAQLREFNKTLIGVVKQLESMRSTYRSLHKYEMPVGNPIDTNIKNIFDHRLLIGYLNFSQIPKGEFHYQDLR